MKRAFYAAGPLSSAEDFSVFNGVHPFQHMFLEEKDIRADVVIFSCEHVSGPAVAAV